jgi:hypothetical protein
MTTAIARDRKMRVRAKKMHLLDTPARNPVWKMRVRAKKMHLLDTPARNPVWKMRVRAKKMHLSAMLRAPLCLEDARPSQEDARLARTGGRVGQRDASLRPVGAPLSFRGALFAPRLATVRVGEPPDERLRQAQREAVARVNWTVLLPKLEKCALSHGASPSEVKDPVHTAVGQLLEGRTTRDPARGTGIQLYLMTAVRRGLSNERRRPRHRYEAPFDDVEDAPDPHADTASLPESWPERARAPVRTSRRGSLRRRRASPWGRSPRTPRATQGAAR